jgi:uncharacterized LabA/DUF88 family protein
MRTAIYVDGFNLYYWLKPTPFRWVDLRALTLGAIQTPEIQHQLVALKYFTARVSDTRADQSKSSRQATYIDALSAYIPEFKPYFGEFRRKRKWMPRVSDSGHAGPMVEVWSTEEKGSDVNLAVELVNDAWCDLYDCAIVVSNDSDLSRALAIVKKKGKKVGVLVRGDHDVVSLRKVSNFQKKLSAAKLTSVLLPREIPGTNIRIPDDWADKERLAGIR